MALPSELKKVHGRVSALAMVLLAMALLAMALLAVALLGYGTACCGSTCHGRAYSLLPYSLWQVHTLSVDEKWQMLLLSGVAAHVPLEPVLNPQGDTSYTK